MPKKTVIGGDLPKDKYAAAFELNKRAKESTDFNKLLVEYGSYSKARRNLKKVHVNAHLKIIEEKDAEIMESRRNDRLKEMIRLSNTTGAPSEETVIDKIIDATAKRPTIRYEGQSIDDQEREFDNDLAVTTAMNNGGELLIPQVGLVETPMALGDTLFLQMGFINNFNLPRNKLHSLLNFRCPQLQLRHLRYMTDINLSGNKLHELPPEIGLLKDLKNLNLAHNIISTLPESISGLDSLELIDLSNNNFGNMVSTFNQLAELKTLLLNNNMFKLIPPVILKLKKLETLDLSFNALQHVAIIPDFLGQDAIWHPGNDPRTGSKVFVNVLTKERVVNIEEYSGRGIEKATDLHTYQTKGTLGYLRRKVWMSVCHVNEWDPVEDPATGWIYYVNNISGETQWEMPAEVDTFDECLSLKYLALNNNMLKGLSNSMTRCSKLVKIDCSNNRMHDLPETLGALHDLQEIVGQNNELKLLPTSIVECISLKRITLQGNMLMRLPDLLGTLPNLEFLDVAGNRLVTLPNTLGFSKTCTYLAVHDNPLEDPDQDEVSKGIDSLKWYLRQRLLIEERGAPPMMQFEHISVMKEVTILNPEWRLRIRHMIKVAKKDGLLNLQLMGLREFPKEILKMGKDLKKLRFDFNDGINLSDGFPQEELSHIKLLSLRACGQTDLHPSIQYLKRLTVLNIEENKYTYLPKECMRIRSITELNASQNHIYEIPTDIHRVTSLRVLNLEGNNLESLPENLFKLKKIKVLNVSRNRIREVSSGISMMQTLELINLECNYLTTMPISLSELKLKSLLLGHNRLISLPDESFIGSLGRTLTHLSIAENNLLELPASIFQINPNALFEADYNPLISPPAYILSEGLGVLQNYLHVRLERIHELEDLLDEEGFGFVKENATPISNEVLDEGTGYLTPQDLIEFDAAVDEYLNGNYFRCPSSGYEITDKLVQLREDRENQLYLTILRVLSNVCLSHKKDKRFGKAVMTKTTRPWGRKGEECSCTVLSLFALLNDTPTGGKYQKDGRESIVSEVEKTLPEMPFPFSVDMLKDALKLYSSPYGQVAEMDEFEFERCDCINLETLRPERHNPCRKPAVIFLNSIITDEEALRREMEEADLVSRYEYIDEAIRRYLNSPDGRIHLKKECIHRRKLLYEEINLRTEMKFMEEKGLSKANKFLEKMKKRVEMYREGVPYDVHEISSDAQADQVLDNAERKLARANARFTTLLGSLEIAMKKKDMDEQSWRLATVEDLVIKYCHLEYEEIIKRYRKISISNEWNRPWDGVDGAEFNRWKNRLSGTDLGIAGMTMEQALVKLEEEDEDMKYEAEKEAEREALREGRDPDEDVDKPEYDWEGCEKMEQYFNPVYEVFKRKRDGITGNISQKFKKGFSKLFR